MVFCVKVRFASDGMSADVKIAATPKQKNMLTTTATTTPSPTPRRKRNYNVFVLLIVTVLMVILLLSIRLFWIDTQWLGQVVSSSPSSFHSTIHQSEEEEEEEVDDEQRHRRKRQRQRRICTQNPYLIGLEEDVQMIAQRMEEWLVPHHVQQLKNDSHHYETLLSFKWNQFAFLHPFTSCQHDHIHCFGGPCGVEESKFTCGVMNTTSTTINNSNDSNSNKKCIVYSLGGNNQWSFELDLLQQTNCEVHTFDCTGNITRFTQIPNHERMFFHHVCVGTESMSAIPIDQCTSQYTKCGETWTIPQMQSTLHHDHIDLFKMDVEGYEWPIFKSWQAMAWENDDDEEEEEKGKSKNNENKSNKNNESTDNSWSLPHQMMVEIHHFTQKPWETVALVEMLMQMGYVVIRRDNNIYCPKCAEFALLRIRCPAVGH
jgi:hypothetical protein